MYISYSGYKLHSKCPLAYWFSYIANVPHPPDNRVNSLYGSVVGAIFEAFYNDEIWKKGKEARKALFDLVEPILDRTIKDETTSSEYRPAGIVKWQGKKGDGLDPKANYTSREELIADIRDAIPRGILSIQFYRLLGKEAASEVKLNSRVKDHTLGGRADFIIRRIKPHSDRAIIDGKGSKYRDLYVDNDQLRWYAALYSLQNEGALPDRLAFLYWRFGPPDSLDWIHFSEDEIHEFLETVIKTVDSIDQRQHDIPLPKLAAVQEANLPPVIKLAFPPKGATKTDDLPCKFCDYVTLCPEGTAALKALNRKARSVGS